MLTVIAPTMWRFSPFLNFVEDIANHPLVGEIIIIDNDPHIRPNSHVLSHEKIKLISFGHNIYLNPAWNVAVQNAKYDKLCFMGDDVVFDTRLFNRAYNYIDENLGMIGLRVDSVENHFVDGIIRINEYRDGESQCGFGQVFFLWKNNYIMIPEDIRIFFGDNFVYDSCIFRNLKIYAADDVFYYTPSSVTTQSLGKEFIENILKSDAEGYKKYLESLNLGLDPYVWCPSIKSILGKQ